MKLWAHTMFKNEAKWLWYSVTSVIDFVDKILLWDTGSTDESPKIAQALKNKYPEKIILNKTDLKTKEDFPLVRQEMLSETKSDWFLVLDGDEIWWRSSIKKVASFIQKEGNNYECAVVPTVNLVGDIYHFQGPDSGKYKFGSLIGHYNLRAVNTKIPGLHSQGVHGVWGWADTQNRMIQDRETYKYIDAPYLHATNIGRSEKDEAVIKRSKKLKYEIGTSFPLDYYYPESFFMDKPDSIASPWSTMQTSFKARAIIETPIRKLKRKLWQSAPGY